MTPDLAIELLKLTIINSILVVAPFLITALVTGLAVSLIQSVTSLQEQTLVFVPKLVAMAAVAVIAGPWILRTLTEFAVSSFGRIADLAR